MIKVRRFFSQTLFAYEAIVLAPSWRCDAHCRHCFLPVKLRRDGKRPDLKVLLRLIQSLPRRIGHIEITGGEPFTDLGFLVRLVQIASASGHATVVVTNGLWSKERDRLKTTLNKLFRAGLHGMAVSVDDYHTPRLSHQELVNLLKEARGTGIVVRLKGCGKAAAPSLRKFVTGGLLVDSSWATENFSVENVGTASRLGKDLVKQVGDGGCLMAMLPMIMPDGNVVACCSARMFEIKNDVLRLGNVNEIDIGKMLSRASRDLLLGAAAGFGPVGMARLTRVGSNQKSITPCALCLSILNDETSRTRLQGALVSSKELRKELVGRIMLLRHNFDSVVRDIWAKASKFEARSGDGFFE